MRTHPWHITAVTSVDPGTDDEIVAQSVAAGCSHFFGDDDLSKVVVKARLMSPRQHNPIKYRLAVPSAERVEDHAYFVGIVDRLEPTIFFRLTGWAWGSDLPDEPEASGVFKGSFCIPGVELRSVWTYEH